MIRYKRMRESLVLRRQGHCASKPAKNPKRRAREAAKALKRPAMSTKAQQALAAQREAMKQESAHARSRRRAEEADARFEQRKLKRKQKHRGH